MHACVQVALQQADYVAWNVWASICGRPLLPFRYQHLGTMVTLGRNAGAVSLSLPVPAGAPQQAGM
jgi:demethylphylloquinone reductase